MKKPDPVIWSDDYLPPAWREDFWQLDPAPEPEPEPRVSWWRRMLRWLREN